MKKPILFIAALLAVTLSQAQWEPDVRLTNDPARSFTSINNQWCVAAKGDTVHAVWYDNRTGSHEIYYKRSFDGGTNWEPDQQLTDNLFDSFNPSISISGSDVHVVWSDWRDGNFEIYYKRSSDRGTNWGEDTRLTIADTSSFNPCIAATGLFVNIIWYDIRDGNWEIYHKRSTDGGLTWEPDMRLTNDPANSFNACLALSGSIVHVVWGEYRDGVNGEIYYKRSTDGGASWGQDIRLTIDADISRRPCVAAYGSIVHVVWYDNRDGDNEIYYKRSTDGGINWGADTRLTNSSGDSKDPSIAVSGSAVHVVWYDNRDGNLEIYYKRSEDGGLNWRTDTRLTDASGDSQYSSIAVSGPSVHVVWYDLRDGNEEIYYKRDPTGGFPVGTENDLTDSLGQQFNIYPNPASTVMNISFNASIDENLALRIIDLSGRTIGRYNFNSSIGLNQYSINLNDVGNGLYFIELTTGSVMYFRKLLISK